MKKNTCPHSRQGDTLRFMMTNSKPQPERRAMRINAFCEAAGISRSTFYRWVEEGRVKVVKIGSITLVPHWQCEAIINAASAEEAA